MINYRDELDTRLTRIVLSAAILLGILVGVAQLAYDVYSQRNVTRNSVQEIVDTIYPLAATAAYELDTQSAEQVITGLIVNPTIYSAVMRDDTDQILGEKKQDDTEHHYSFLLSWTLADLETFERILRHPNFEEPVGSIAIQLDIDSISEGLLYRAVSDLIFGLIRNVLLAIILLYFFRKIVTSPLTAISQSLKNIDQTIGGKKQIDFQPEHEHDELGELVSSINGHLSREEEVSKRLRQSQKMEAVGQLTGGIAHDFNNTLAVILGNLELIELRVSEDETSVSHVLAALRGVDRGAEITRKLLNYSRVDTGSEKIVLINVFIKKMEKLIAKSLTASINTTTHLAENIWPVRINAGDLQDALLNLSLNARDAMPDGGDLIIESSNKILDEDYVRRNPQAEAGEYVMITISDSGIGMTLEACEKALEPFFTTKEEGKGTGLGLSMVYSFVQRSKGHLKIYSEVGEGTTIRLYLPRAYEDGEIENEKPNKNLLQRGNETILVVDDEADLIAIATAHLESLGYKTLTANTGKRALELLDHNKDIDLLFSDVIMPGGMDGYKLALAAHKMRPSLKILLTSGFTKKREEYVNGEREYLSELTSRLVDKPYNRLELANAVRRALDDGKFPSRAPEPPLPQSPNGSK